MCVILGKMETQEKPSTELLRACWESNPHGGGIMWRDGIGAEIKVHKGLMSFGEFLKIAEAVPDGAEAWYHARIVSRGGICQEQCHPFYLRGGAWFMHNGTFHIEPWQGMSDTQTVGEYLNENPGENIAAVLRGLCRESGSKVALMAPGKKTQLFGQWEEYGGYKASNTYFAPSLRRGEVKRWVKSKTLCESCANYGDECFGLLPEYYTNCLYYKKA